MGKTIGPPGRSNLASPDPLDIIPILDVSTGVLKYITYSQLAGPVISTDANGWKVRDYSSFKTYEKSHSVSASSVTNGQRNTIASSQPLPVGISNVNQVRAYASWRGNFGGHAVPGFDCDTALPGTTYAAMLANQYAGGALSFTGKIDILLVDL